MIKKGGGMDDNYLMRKEGLTMTNENRVEHKSVAVAQSHGGVTGGLGFLAGAMS